MKTTLIVDDLTLVVEEPIPASPVYAPAEILAYAVSAAPQDSRDPGDKALFHAAQENEIPLNFAPQGQTWEPPTAERPFSIIELQDLSRPEARTIKVARGNLQALEELCQSNRLVRKRIQQAFKDYTPAGFTPVAIAIQRPNSPWRLLGVVPMHAMRKVKHLSKAKAEFRYFHIWDWPLRVLHWVWVVAIIILTMTGFCIAEGWFLNVGELDNGFNFGNLRFVHYAFGWMLIVLMMLRFACFFMASNRYQSFKSLFPVSKQEFQDLITTAKDYLFARSYDGPRYIGHNPLQQWSYTGVYCLFTVMILTGLALYSLYEPTHWFYQWFMPINELLGVANVRLIHLIGTWCFCIFAMIHIYLSILAGNVDRDGTIASMFSGGRWLRKGVHFRDE